MIFVYLLIAAMACNLIVKLTINDWFWLIRKIFESWLPPALNWLCVALAVLGGILLIVRIAKADRIRKTLGTFVLVLFSAAVLGVVIYLSTRFEAVKSWIVWYTLVCVASVICYVCSLIAVGIAQRKGKTEVSL